MQCMGIALGIGEPIGKVCPTESPQKSQQSSIPFLGHRADAAACMTGTEHQIQPWTKPGLAGSIAGHPQTSATSQSRLSAEIITEIQDAASMSSATASCSASSVRSPRDAPWSLSSCAAER